MKLPLITHLEGARARIRLQAVGLQNQPLVVMHVTMSYLQVFYFV